jgi:hypothetical protein
VKKEWEERIVYVLMEGEWDEGESMAFVRDSEIEGSWGLGE